MNITKHAQMRMAQRGISLDMVKIIEGYGRTRCANGAEITDMDERSVRCYLREDPAPKRQAIERVKNVYYVTIDGWILTTARKNTSYKKKFN